MNLVFPRIAPLLLACSLACGAVACGEAAAEDGDVASADETSAKLETGTYKLEGEAAAWTIKQLILRDDSTYTVEMYPGRAFPIDFTKITEGKYVQTASKLTIKFAKGNDFNSWTVEKVGSTFQLTDTEEGNTFTLVLDSKSTTFDPGPVQGVDPGMPPKSATQAAIACHSGQADIYLNAVVDVDGKGKAWITSAKELKFGDTVDKITLVNELPEEDTTEWVHPSGKGTAGYEPRKYIINLTTDFIRNGGKDVDVSVAIGSAEYESEAFESWGFTCSSDGI
jgi:hypothetical protein